MIKESVTPQDAVDYLNDLLEKDYEAVEKLIFNRVQCNEALANHPTCQVMADQHDKYEVGLLGVLNGLFGVDQDDNGCLVMLVDAQSQRIVNFVLMDENDDIVVKKEETNAKE
jgi:hypothetical protein